MWTGWSSIFRNHLFCQVVILFFLALDGKCGLELNQVFPPTCSDDLCLPFCLILILCSSWVLDLASLAFDLAIYRTTGRTWCGVRACPSSPPTSGSACATLASPVPSSSSERWRTLRGSAFSGTFRLSLPPRVSISTVVLAQYPSHPWPVLRSRSVFSPAPAPAPNKKKDFNNVKKKERKAFSIFFFFI